MILLVSKSDYCSGSSDGSMFLNMKAYNKITKNDCIACNGCYTLFIKQFLELSENKGKDLCDDNFIYPIRKDLNADLNEQEKYFNRIFGSLRSTIENQFGELSNKSKGFSNNNSVVKLNNIKYYNLQFKMACLLKNIRKFSEMHNILIQPQHKLLEGVDFKSPIEKSWQMWY